MSGLRIKNSHKICFQNKIWSLFHRRYSICLKTKVINLYEWSKMHVVDSNLAPKLSSIGPKKKPKRILTFEFDLSLGLFLTFWGPNGLLLRSE